MLIYKNYLGDVTKAENIKSFWETLDTQNFLTPEEVVEDLFNTWDDKSKKEFLAVGYENLIMLHHGFGTSIRNIYGLWHPKYPGSIPGDLGDGHPDGISMKIIEGLYKRIETQHSAFDDAMSIIQEK
ncbi:MAG: hypothetical protein KGI25_09780 [Thaumarchaeota archaeon]|nr:hypothetical protein [Nitrososphaerota archaeon]